MTKPEPPRTYECLGPNGERCGVRHRSYMAMMRHVVRLNYRERRPHS